MTTIHDDLRDHMLAVERELMQVKRERDEARELHYLCEKALATEKARHAEVRRQRDSARQERDSARQAFAAADKRRQEAEVWVERLRDALRVATSLVCSATCRKQEPSAPHTPECQYRRRVIAGNLEGF